MVKKKKNNLKKKLLNKTVEHLDISQFNATPIIEAMNKMSFSAREIANASKIFKMMLEDESCSIILTIAGSAGAAGCLNLFADMLKYNMVDIVVATGAAIVDMDFFEALGFRHYQATKSVDDKVLRDLYIDRIYDTYIDEDDLQECDKTITQIADSIKPDVYSSREFIKFMGEYLKNNSRKKGSLVETAFDYNIPIFCPAFSDSSAGFGLVMHQHNRINKNQKYVSIDSVKDFYELTKLKIKAKNTGLFMIGGGVPKNFAQDTVICAEMLNKKVAMHKYAVQITVADQRDGGCSGSTLKEACSWGKVSKTFEQMVFAETTTVLPLIANYVLNNVDLKNRSRKNYNLYL